MSKSRPLYGPLRVDATGRRHLFLLQTIPGETTAEALQFYENVRVEVWAVEGTPARGIVGETDWRGFTSQGAMFDALCARLRTETMGLRLYALGDEAFLWDLFGLACAAGLGREEVRLSQVGEPVRRVYCTHCTMMNEGVRSDLVVCRGCGLTLSVRDHFSRRLSAFMGVHADAEAPGELRQPQALGS